jgi:hypothetical protein
MQGRGSRKQTSGGSPKGSLPGDSSWRDSGFKPYASDQHRVSSGSCINPRLITRSLVCERGARTTFGKHLHFIVMSVIVVTVVTLPIAMGFICDGLRWA